MVREAWKEVFGVELSASWFDIVGAGGTLPDGSTLSPLKNQSPNNKLNYRTLHDGVEYEFPYSIAIVKVPSNWVGPVLDFEKDVAGEPQLTEKSIKKGTMLYITSQKLLSTKYWSNLSNLTKKSNINSTNSQKD